MAITFKDRVSENPNRRKLTVVSSTNGEIQIADEIVVDVERDEGTITEQGTLFSASNMNTLMAADAVIRNQNEFDALVGQFNATIGSSDPAVIAACPKTIVLVGGGGNSPNGAYTVPLNGINLPWVKTGYFHLQGINGAKLYWDSTGVEGIRSAIDGNYSVTRDEELSFKIENIRLNIVGDTTHTVTGIANCAGLENVVVEGSVNGFTAVIQGFKDCTNLINCNAILSNTRCAGFVNCYYIINCIANIAEADTASDGFGYCHYLINCYSYVESATNGYLNAYSACTELMNCRGSVYGITSDIYSFKSCISLSNCTAKAASSGPSQAYGFYACQYASNCKDDGSYTDMWYGTNKAIDPVTCKKTPATANNGDLNS